MVGDKDFRNKTILNTNTLGFEQAYLMGLFEKETLFRREKVKIDNI
jgi:hypothetical protein